jgi:hypothetical protein
MTPTPTDNDNDNDNNNDDDDDEIEIRHAIPTDSGITIPVRFLDSTADRLRRNDQHGDGTTLDLDSALDIGDDLDDFLDAVHGNTTISTLQLEGDMICSLNPDDGSRLFDALGGLPALTRLHLHNYVAPLQLLACLVERARLLRRISLHTAQLLGRNEDESRQFLMALETLQHLQDFKCSNAIVAGQGLSLETLVRGLSRLPNIQRVELELERGGEVTLDTLEALCTCPHMEELRLWRITLHPEHLIRIAGIIQNNTTVRHLELGEMGYADHNIDTYAAVAQMLSHNTCLESFDMINFSGLKDDGCMLMANALRSNHTLTDLSVRGSDNHVLGVEAAQAVATMFSHNQTMRQFSFNTVGVDDHGAVVLAAAIGHHNHTLQTLMLQRIVGNKQRGYLAFQQMLQTNFQLRRVFPEAEADIKQKMDFYLTLNRLGLRHVQLYVDTSRTQFLQMLSGSRHDLDVIFYLLSTNPEFLDVV